MTESSPLKYVEHAVTMAEVPLEISLTISISNCAYRCHGYHAFTDREDVACRERDKLTGGCFTVPEMREARRSGHMESWSAMCFDMLLDVLMDALEGTLVEEVEE